jgi:hypothetical protein
MAAGLKLGPKGTAFLKARLKSFDDITDPDAELPAPIRFNKVIEDARAMDGAPAPAAAPNVGGTETVQAKEVSGPPVAIAHPKTLEEAAKLPKGTKFMWKGDERTRN